MSRPLVWDSDGRDWPHRQASRFVAAGSLTWHVQEMGSGPALVLLHGTGAATHSWRHLMPLLAQHNRVIAMDLPGHGFTRGRPAGGLTLPGMAAAVATLLQELEVQPERLIGHSAGAAIALRMVRDGFAVPEVVGLNAALSPFPGFFAPLFQGLARALVLNPLVPRLFAASARTSGNTGRLLVRSTGSHIDAEGVRCYAMLLGNALHCRGALEMMAGWDLAGLQRDLPKVMARVRLIHGAKDAAVPVGSVEQAVKLMPQASLEVLAGLGHLAHEERAGSVAAAMAVAATVHA